MPNPTLHPSSVNRSETTQLNPLEEVLFKSWATANGIKDVDAPDSFYDYRGFYKSSNGHVHPPGSVEHFPDTFKQHGHPTFSIESKYSKGPSDGGMWVPNHATLGSQTPDGPVDTFLPQMQPAVSHETPAQPSTPDEKPNLARILLQKAIQD